MGFFEQHGTSLLAQAGIEVNGTGTNKWDIRTDDPEALFRKIMVGGPLAFSEAYMNGEWDCDDLITLLCRIFRVQLDRQTKGLSTYLLRIRNALTNQQTKFRALKVAKNHYDLGNEFYALWLDPSMTYSAARWEGVTTLADAQAQKRKLIIEKMHIEPGMDTLDIGCGWGSLAEDISRTGDCNVVGVTISHEQALLARERCKGLPVRILEKDYRDVLGRFDRIVSVGMLEHVGVKNFDVYMEKAYDLLYEGGLFVCHAIVSHPGAKDPFLDRYIFPGGELGSTWQIQKAAEKAGFKVEDWENFGYDYYLTLMEWEKNFTERLEEVRKHITPDIIRVFGSEDRFVRGWRLYLFGTAAAFYTRKLSVGQWVLSKNFTGSVYKTARP